ncbi:MAG: hypothetical protein FWF46_02285 [Oscillospiraceae bacterium]|nr:hypothetical protein [Oscillospiraceae bacterium]
MKKRSLLILTNLIIIFILLFSLSSTKVYARDNLAFSAGTTANGVNTVQIVNDAMNGFSSAGYKRYSYIDPSKSTLWSYLYADVQLFTTHGNLTAISFANSGIRVGSDNTTHVGTDSVHWDADTILVTYVSCEGAGTNNSYNTGSITAKTALRGADVAVGFRNTIAVASAQSWSKRYTEKLGQGYGVLDAVNYASSFIYLDGNVKQVQIVHHGNANMKIGKYKTSTSSSIASNIVADRDILSTHNINTESLKSDIVNMYGLKSDSMNISSLRGNILNVGKLKRDNLSIAINYIEEVYPDINIDDYIVTENTGTMTTDINTGKTESQTEYIDLQLKIGDFVTTVGYTIGIKNGEVEAIYDNNIDTAKQEEAINSKENFKVEITSTKLKQFEQNAKNSVAQKYAFSGIEVQDNTSTTYYYDVETSKKYVLVTVPTTTKTGEMAYDTVPYEI